MVDNPKVNLRRNVSQNEGFLRFFPNKSAFYDKLKVSCPAGVANYLIFMHCFWTQYGISLGLTTMRAV